MVLSNNHFYKALFFLCLCMGIGFPVHAAEQIRFDRPVSLRAQQNIHLYAHETLDMKPEDIKIAGVDLNEDGINEFIVSPLNCSDSKEPCTYLVLADKGKDIINLGQIDARRISLGDGYSHGVRDLLAFNNKNNDFDGQLYIWEPARSRYIMKGGGSEHE